MLPGSGWTAQPNAESFTSIDVVTFNLQTDLTGDADDERMELVIDVLNTIEPDLVALQEVYESPSQTNRAQLIAEATGMEWFWTATHDVTGLYAEGPAILSPWPVSWSDEVRLPHPDLVIVERATLGIVADLPDVDVPFFSAHLTTSSNSDHKLDQVMTSLEFMAPHGPGVFAGDMNAEPDSAAMTRVRESMADAWVSVRPAEPGLTFSSSSPDRRIDYVYADRTFAIESCAPILDAAVGGLWASDHIGIHCTIQVPSNRDMRRPSHSP